MVDSLRLMCLSLLLGIVISCTPKVAEPIQEVVTTPPPVVEDTNPCMTLDELSASMRDEVETAYVLYKDLVKQKKYKEAFPLWEKAYYGAPAANGSIKYQFEDGIKIYRHFYNNSNDSIQKQMYTDTIMALYDKRIECFGDPAYVAGRKAFDKYYYYQDQSDMEQIYTCLLYTSPSPRDGLLSRMPSSA